MQIARRGFMKSYREVQPRILTAFFGSKVNGITFALAHPFDFYAARGNHVGGRVPSPITQECATRFRRKRGFTAEEMHHHFAIEALGKPGSFRSQPYIYTCVRCKWIFRVNDPRGSIIALDGLGRHLPEPENTKRALTFQLGPCSAFPHFEYLSPEPRRSIKLLTLVGFLSRVVRAFRVPLRGKQGNRRYPKAAASSPTKAPF
jgi:hypothetical protein